MAVSRLYKNGNSVVVAIPEFYLKHLSLKAGDFVKIFLGTDNHYNYEGPLVIRRATKGEISGTATKP